MRKDITGQRFGRLLAIEPTQLRSGSATIWLCECVCGNEHYASISKLNGGKVKSCGCWKEERFFRWQLDYNHAMRGKDLDKIVELLKNKPVL